MKSSGFSNIELVPIYDITFGIFSIEKEVAKVVIDDQEIYVKGDEFLNTFLVQIYYHVFF